MECIVLAGGLGTRLRGAIGDQPKCMADVNGKPFLHYILSYLQQQQCKKVVLSLGYKHEVVLAWLHQQHLPFEVDYVVEEEPLGTGGGIQLAMQKTNTDDVAVLNGDTFFNINLPAMMALHTHTKPAATIALKKMHDFDRYGVVRTDSNDNIISFEEKKPATEGYINGGVYIINKPALFSKQLPAKFSFEKDYLEAYVHQGVFKAGKDDGYFIDIGIPTDYNKAQHDLKMFFV